MNARFTSAAAAAGPAPSDSRSIDDLDLAIRKLARQMNAETHRLLLLVRDFDDRFGWAKWGCRNCAEWLAWRCGLSMSAAREKVRTAQALRNLPAISAAFADGRLSYSKVRALTRAAHLHDEHLLLAYALDATAVQVEERCRQIRNAEPESVHEARRVWERRSLALFRDRVRGVVRIVVELPIEEGELIGRAIDSAVAAGDVAMGVEFTSDRERTADSWRAQQVDALVAIAKAYLGGGSAVSAATPGAGSASVADHYQVVVHVDDKALRGGVGRSDLAIETVKRLTCDGSLITIVEDDRGTPLDVGRKQRTVSTPLKRALWSRDRGCSFPGCHNAHYVDAHHIRHWAAGGDTKIDNLTLVCKHHHTLLHEGGFDISRDEQGAIYFRRPDGRVIPRSGYRAEDMLDDFAVECAQPSAEGRMAAIVHGFENAEDSSAEGWMPRVEPNENPSAEVCEERAVYRVRVSPPGSRAAPSTARSRLHGMRSVRPPLGASVVVQL